MDVTKSNFAEVLPEIQAALSDKDCTHVAIDFEMTGIGLTDRSFRTNYGDTPLERYAKMRPVASRYSIIQMGLAIFRKASGGKKAGAGGKKAAPPLEARVYNIYTFAEDGADVVLSASAVAFLRDNGMDFNRWFREGVAYTGAQGEAQLQEKMDQERERDRQQAEGGGGSSGGDANRVRLTRAADKEFVATQMGLLKAWYESGDGEAAAPAKGASPEEVADAARRRKELLLGKCNAFLRRALFEAVQDGYPSLIAETRNGQVAVLRLTEEEKQERLAAREEERKQRFDAAVGARHVFTAIGASGKPLVVHNGMYDLMFAMAAFHGPLPERLEDFKRELKLCFPKAPIFDTKYTASREDLLGVSLPDTTLEPLYASLVTEPGWTRVRLAPGFEKYLGGEEEEGERGKEKDKAAVAKPSFAHEAGYDAYLTGAAHAKMAELLSEKGEDKLALVADRVFNYRSLFETHLAGEDPRAHAGKHVFHLGIDPKAKNVKSDDLMKMFGSNSIHVNVLWIDDTGAFALVDEASGDRKDVLAGIKPLEGVKLTEFEAWYAAKRRAEAAAGAAGQRGAEDDEATGALAWIMKRTLSLIGWGDRQGGEVKRMRVA